MSSLKQHSFFWECQQPGSVQISPEIKGQPRDTAELLLSLQGVYDFQLQIICVPEPNLELILRIWRLVCTFKDIPVKSLMFWAWRLRGEKEAEKKRKVLSLPASLPPLLLKDSFLWSLMREQQPNSFPLCQESLLLNAKERDRELSPI